MSLEDEDSFFHGNFPMCRCPVVLAVEFRVVRLILLEHIVDGREQHPGNGDNGFLVAPAFSERQITIADFRELLGTNRTEGALNQQRFDIGPSPADSGGFLLSSTLVVLQRKPSLESVLKPGYCVKNDDVIEWEHEET